MNSLDVLNSSLLLVNNPKKKRKLKMDEQIEKNHKVTKKVPKVKTLSTNCDENTKPPKKKKSKLTLDSSLMDLNSLLNESNTLTPKNKLQKVQIF